MWGILGKVGKVRKIGKVGKVRKVGKVGKVGNMAPLGGSIYIELYIIFSHFYDPPKTSKTA